MSKEEHMREIRGARAFGVIRTVLLGITMLLPLEVRADVMFQGNLLDRPCKVDPASQMQDVTFLDTATPLYWVWPGKSAEKTFQVTLVNCYASTLGKVVKLTFSGAEELALPGYLATTGANAGRLAIGFLDTDGSTLLRLGTPHHNGAGDVVTGSSLTLKFKAFVQATPDAISQKSVVPGDYSATATFEVNYQ
jgi:minor pilin subunit PapK